MGCKCTVGRFLRGNPLKYSFFLGNVPQILGAADLVEGLYIRYREVSDKPEYQMVTVLNAGATSYVLTNLNKYTRYEFFLVPFFKTIEGRPSNVKLATTLEDVPSGAPENVHVGMINVTSAFVRWSPPPKNTQNGQLIGYKVNIRSSENSISRAFP